MLSVFHVEAIRSIMKGRRGFRGQDDAGRTRGEGRGVSLWVAAPPPPLCRDNDLNHKVSFGHVVGGKVGLNTRLLQKPDSFSETFCDDKKKQTGFVH